MGNFQPHDSYKKNSYKKKRYRYISQQIYLYTTWQYFEHFRILKKTFLKNEKMANRKLGNPGNLGNLGIIIPSFLISEFSILAVGQNRKLRFKYLGKKLPRFPRFPRFPSFRPGQFTTQNCTVWVYNLKIQGKIKCRSSQRRRFIKEMFLKISQYSQENTSVGVSF